MSSTTKIEVDLIQGIVDKRNRIIASSNEKASQIIDAAKTECNKIKNEADKEVEAIINSRIRGIRNRIVSEVDMQARHKLLITRDKLILSVFDETLTRLRTLSEDEKKAEEYLDVLAKLLKEAMDNVGGESFIILANARDMKLIGHNLKKIERKMKIPSSIKLEMSKVPVDCVGGLILESGDETKMYYNTLNSRLTKIRRGIVTDVAKMLEMI